MEFTEIKILSLTAEINSNSCELISHKYDSGAKKHKMKQRLETTSLS